MNTHGDKNEQEETNKPPKPEVAGEGTLFHESDKWIDTPCRN
jgi:hypothetical protein